ncbi:uncharacterized protein CcaverHIS019_0704560 [Cutaneotrichosporon cavernicola]|uniref:DUF6534 domain-containing protein n=1 Tax=Cutaneotrichosporon cavernicola TaxID=279322 RepID=A0AA48QZ24_9TREE|nr:uncharacterized protein CcaverHIS019_0704560 [Cutaneotrichosporon cavernicola]BEI94875.1 hypothetical protein CcaverHIS019_0704560 [Cutaneotrichosporon cavernicola]BEJ10405.1 hypothetical protein CcaverHIS641_0704400 [Cutaneotrichosporon cavernicola]
MTRPGVLPHPTEEEAAAMFKPRQTFSLACMFAGLFIDTYLMGIFLMLLVRYMKSAHQKGDTNWTRLCVIGATLGTLAASAYQWWLVSHRFVTNFGRYQSFFEATPGSWFPLLDCAHPICNSDAGITALFTQSFFTHRAFLLNGRNWFLVITPVLLMCGSLACTLAVKIIFASLSSTRDAKFVYIPTVIWLSFSTSTDVIITGAILHGLIKSRTGWSRTNLLITRLVRLTLEAQIPATMSAIIYLAAFLSIAIVYFQSKLYVIGLLYSLNVREALQGMGSQIHDTSSRDDFWSPPVTTIHVPVDGGTASVAAAA